MKTKKQSGIALPMHPIWFKVSELKLLDILL